MGEREVSVTELISIIKAVGSLSDKIVGEDVQISQTTIASTDKGAVLNRLVDKYLENNLDNEILREAIVDYGINERDVAGEILKRELNKVLR